MDIQADTGVVRCSELIDLDGEVSYVFPKSLKDIVLSKGYSVEADEVG